ncbi:hypothetical protein LOTGIDRAFT_237787 [Lottia gigantea]|uniref:Uncharacterized protein n=1 Tax=Lottia gigantea TaxID=225164 RepID=V4CLJ0_LOTGI|nr:hypothetical protein LOTGIDRAFT_237787 [Lottia gigantea]ESP03170.1 hypothetical protein LOTGIDRAFT_237787 [Lottia gigantea]
MSNKGEDMDESANEKIDWLRRKLVLVFGIVYSAVVILPVILTLLICFQGSWQSGYDSSFYMDHGNRYPISEFLQSNNRVINTVAFYLRGCLFALFMSELFGKRIVMEFYQRYPDIDMEGEDGGVIINCTIKQYCDRGSETDTIYFKRRRRYAQKTTIIREKTRSELKKIRKKSRNLNEKYQMKGKKAIKDIGCKEILIGELEFRRTAILTHLTQLKYYVIHSRSELETQRNRNKAIPDTIDNYGNLVSTSLVNAQMIY